MKTPNRHYLVILTLVALVTLLTPTSQAGEKLLVSSLTTQDVLSFDSQTGDFNETFISTPSHVGTLRGVTVGPDGDIYACSRTSGRVLRFDGETGCFKETFDPENSADLSSPVDLAFGPDGYLYVVSPDEGVFQFDGTTGDFIDHIIELDDGYIYELYAPSGLLIDEVSNRLLVSDMNNGSILEFDLNVVNFEHYLVAPYSAELDAPRYMAWGPDGNVYVSSLTNGGAILRFNYANGAFIDTFVDHGSGGLDMPEGIAFGPGGDLFVSDIIQDRILKFDGTSGDPLGEFVPSGSHDMNEPYGLVFGQEGNLYVATNATGLYTFDGQTGDFLTAVYNGHQLGNPRGLALGPDGDLYISDGGHDEIQRYDSQNGCFISPFVPMGTSPLNLPRDLVFGPDDNLYVVGSSDGVFQFHGPTGSFMDIFVPVDFGAEYVLEAPAALLFGPDDNLYVCDMNNGSVLRFDGTTGAYIDDFVPPYSGNLDAPQEMVFGPDGHLYISSLYDDGTILRFDGASGDFIDVFVSSGSGGLGQPAALVFGPDNHLYVSDYWNDRVLKFDGANGAPLGAFVSAGSGDLSGPYNLLFVVDNVVSVADGTPGLHRNLLQANFPNPFNPMTKIEYRMPEPGLVELGIFDARGHHVAMLVDGQRDAGWHEVIWQGTDRAGRRVPSGLYFYRLETGGYSETRKMMMLK